MLLAQFKVFSANDDGTSGRSLPSWAIDWRLSARFFLYEQMLSGGRRKVYPGKTDSHARFCKDNREHNAIIPYNKLIVRGALDSTFYVTKNFIWQKRRLRPDKVAWCLKFNGETTDLIVRLHGFSRPDEFSSGGLSLLRPVGKEEFKLIAFLPWESIRELSLYRNWMWAPKTSRSEVFPGLPTDGCRRLAVDPEDRGYRPEFGYNKRAYTIV